MRTTWNSEEDDDDDYHENDETSDDVDHGAGEVGVWWSAWIFSAICVTNLCNFVLSSYLNFKYFLNILNIFRYLCHQPVQLCFNIIKILKY